MRNINQKGFAALTLIAVLVVVGIVGTGVYVFKKSSGKNSSIKESTSSEKKDAADNTSKTDEEESAVIITEEKAEELAQESSQVSPDATPQNTAPQPTIDEYGPSTKLDRPNVHGVVLGTSNLYSKYLYALQSVDQDHRQSASNQFIIDNKESFSDSFYQENYNSTANLSLFRQTVNVKLATSLRIGSAIVDPEDPTKAIVQIFLEPDKSYSLIVNVKTKDYLGNFGTIEKVSFRQNRNPL